MKHPSEWRYTDEAFHETWREESCGLHKPNQKVFLKYQSGYKSLGIFNKQYLHSREPSLQCAINEDGNRAWVMRWAAPNEPLAELRKIDSPRQLVEWCMMVREMVDD